MKDNPCDGPLDTTVIAADGSTHVTHPDRPANPPIDCFYVYPTISEQKSANATITVDAQVRGVTVQQAARFSTQCRVFAPVYPQVTLTAPTDETGETTDANAAAKAYKGVEDAWEAYLSHYNDGRGVVLIGHSQGAEVLTHLIRDKIDANSAMRRKLVSAILLGGNITVPKGKDVGGSFSHIPACRSTDQLHCVIAYSSFGGPPPADALYGRVTTRAAEMSDTSDEKDLEVLCTNPAALGGGKAALTSVFGTELLPGVMGPLMKGMFGGNWPTAPTTWVEEKGSYEGECVNADGSDVLRVTPVGDAPKLSPAPTPEWGLHIVDVNLALGNLVADVKAQADAYTK